MISELISSEWLEQNEQPSTDTLSYLLEKYTETRDGQVKSKITWLQIFFGIQTTWVDLACAWNRGTQWLLGQKVLVMDSFFGLKMLSFRLQNV